ncbi:hypothetical protein EDD18DRAFT_1346532 [Armillaria luteobubalina]|uniref:C2H2-type domain-containing protein n=1 Tax=Armillaria luteobubalina TaxID=153913 RepID=A0AA39USW9_9AGAR|nr:hypothetical protein EDD18DRAFT_1346532 [Armillaria luteobubalina]
MTRQTNNEGEYLCNEEGCDQKVTRKHDLERHKKTHLDGERRRKAQHPCPITETGCDKRMLQFGNLKKHVMSKHRDVAHLVCFDCRPEFQRFHDIVALYDHVQLEHAFKPRRKVVKQPQDTTSLLPPTPYSNSYIFPPSPTGRFPLPPSPPPPHSSGVEPLGFVTITPPPLSEDEPRPLRSPSPRRTEWYRATRSHLKLYKNARDACRRARGYQLPSPVPSSSTTDEELESSSSRSPSPSPTSQVISQVSEFDGLPSSHSSGSPSCSSTPPYTNGGTLGFSEGMSSWKTVSRSRTLR